MKNMDKKERNDVEGSSYTEKPTTKDGEVYEFSVEWRKFISV